jgi:hypothetical protein
MAVPPASYLIVPYAQTDAGVQVLLARASLVNMRAQGGASPQIIPDHAGQWTLVDGDVPVVAGQPPMAGAFKLFNARTGVNLADPAVLTRFGFSSPTVKPLQDARASDFTALYLQTNAPGLVAFATAINNNLQQRSPATDGVLVEVKAEAASAALSRIGPFAKPTSGWRGVIVDKVYGGRVPQAMDTTFPALVNQIAARSQEPADWYEIALKQLPGGDVPPVEQPRLVRLEVDNAEPAGDRAYAATYDPSGAVTVRAVVEPSGAGTGIVWTGGAGSGDRCTVSLNQITKAGQPLTITAALGGTRLSVTLIIRPRLVSANVAGADRSTSEGSATEQVWIARYDETETAQITIVMAPDTPDAYEHLQWTGGGQPGRAKNIRVIPRNTLTAVDSPLRVRAAVNPWYDFIFYVFPWLRRVEAVPLAGAGGAAAAGVYNAGGGNYEVDVLAATQYTVRAVIFPNTVFAQQFVSMTRTPPGGVAAAMPAGISHNVNRFPIDTFGAPTVYTAQIVRGVHVYQSETARVLVQPVLNGLAPAGCAIAGAMAGAWYSYNVGAAAGGGGIWRPNVEPAPGLRVVRAVPDTTPPISDPLVAAHLRWGMTVGGVAVAPPPAGPVQNMPLNVVTNYAVTVRIGSDPAPARGRALTLNVLARENYVAGNPHLAVTNATFAGGGAVICDNTAMAYGIAFNAPFNGPHWVAGRAHNLQEPRTYAAGAVIQQGATVAVPVAPAAPTNVNIRATAFVPRGNNATTRVTWTHATWNNVGAVGPIALGAINGAPALPAEVAFADPLPMFWEMQVIGPGGPGPWILFDMTSQIVYVTLAAPIGYVARPLAGAAPPPVPAPVLYHTLLATSCRAAHGKVNNADVVERNYSVFTAINPANGANANLNRPWPAGAPQLAYWLGYPPALPSYTVPALLQSATGAGSCGAFAELFLAMGALHGINTLHVVDIDPAVAVGAPGIMVKNWAFNAAPAVWPGPPAPQPPVAYTHYWTAQPGVGVVPPAPAAGNAVWGLPPPPGLVGQNNSRPPPQFADHAIVIDISTAGAGTSGTLYDPSYGSPTVNTAPNYVAAAIAGLVRAFNFGAAAGGVRRIVGYQAMPPGTVNVTDISAVAAGLIAPAAVL